MEITRQKFIESIKKQPFYTRPCSFCGYEMSYCFRGIQLGHDNGCDCVNYDGWRPIPEVELDFYLEPKNGHLEKIKEFIEQVETHE